MSPIDKKRESEGRQIEGSKPDLSEREEDPAGL